MNKLSIRNPLFEKLAFEPPEWWTALVRDKEISIQIRKDNYIDVYFNGGNIIRKLVFNGRAFKGETHYKYIPLKSGTSDYVPFSFENNLIEFGAVAPMRAESFCREILRGIKDNISKYYPSDSEKAIQYAFIKNDPHFIDSEFEYSYKESTKIKTVRIDLVRIDIKAKRIVFVEVKTIGDRRLFNEEIVSQLKDYKNFIMAYRSELLSYYDKILTIKKRLKILPECLMSEQIVGYQVLEKPLLLFGDCEQAWINKISGELDNKIRPYAIGCYYFGKPDYQCDLIKETKRNRHIFCTV